MSRYMLDIAGVKFYHNCIDSIRQWVIKLDPDGSLSKEIELYDSIDKVYLHLWTGKVIDVDWVKEGF